jgi:hypothetical protein
MAVTQVTKSVFQTTLCDQRCMWLDANAGVTVYPLAQPAVVTSRLVVGAFPTVGASGSGSRTATATQTTETNFFLGRQFPPADTYSVSADFAPNAGILICDPFVSRSPREITVTLSGNVYALGVQVQSATFGAFTGTVVFRNAATATLLSVVVVGATGAAGDDSAEFFGAKDTAGAIRSIVITTTNDADGICLNGVDIRVAALVAEAPVQPPSALDCGHPIAHTPCVEDEV